MKNATRKFLSLAFTLAVIIVSLSAMTTTAYATTYSITLPSVANGTVITDRAVSKWETGRGTPKFSDTPILASIFGVTTDYLFGCEK